MQSLFPTDDSAKYLTGNALVCADNIDILRELPSESVDLTYLDPPFQSDSNYVAIFGDKGQVDQQLKDIWLWTTETERTFPEIAHGALWYDALKGIRLQAGSTVTDGGLLCIHGPASDGDVQGLEGDGDHLSTLRLARHATISVSSWMPSLGRANFRNAIVWQRRIRTAHTLQHASTTNTHDTLLFYSGSR